MARGNCRRTEASPSCLKAKIAALQRADSVRGHCGRTEASHPRLETETAAVQRAVSAGRPFALGRAQFAIRGRWPKLTDTTPPGAMCTPQTRAATTRHASLRPIMYIPYNYTMNMYLYTYYLPLGHIEVRWDPITGTSRV